jgi:hypothetical protein
LTVENRSLQAHEIASKFFVPRRLSLNYFRIANLSANNSVNNPANASVAGVRMVSRKLQQVSAPFASGVNPKVTGGRNLSFLAKNDNGPGPCADDRSKRRLCQHIVDVASQFGARTVAVGVETHADFVAARKLGFDLIQGFLFAKPMGVRTFLRTMPPDSEAGTTTHHLLKEARLCRDFTFTCALRIRFSRTIWAAI